MAKDAGYRDLFLEKNYMRNFYAKMVNRFGDSIDALAFAWMVYEITGDRSWSAIIFGLNTLPTILLMPLAGVLVEKYDKRLVMILADICRAVLVSIIAVLYMTGLVQPWMLAVSTFLMSTFEAFRIPAGLALYPSLVSRSKYALATSFGQSMSGVFAILGTGAFGVILSTIGLQGAMFINAATFGISAWLVHTIDLPRQKTLDTRMNVKHFFVELKGGFSYFIKRRIVFLICMVGSLLGVLLVPMNSLMTPYIRESLGQGEAALSTINIASTIGTMAGAALFPLVNKRFSKASLFLFGGFCVLMTYIAYIAISFMPPAALAMLAALACSSFCVGFGMSFMSVIVNVSFMEQIESSHISRVGSIFNSLSSALVPVSSFLVAALAATLTVNQVFAIFAGLTFLMFTGLAANKLFRTIDHPPAQEGIEA